MIKVVIEGKGWNDSLDTALARSPPREAGERMELVRQAQADDSEAEEARCGLGRPAAA